MVETKVIPVFVNLSPELVAMIDHVAAVNDETAPNRSATMRVLLKLGIDSWRKLQGDKNGSS